MTTPSPDGGLASKDDPGSMNLVDGFVTVAPEYYDNGPDGCVVKVKGCFDLEIVDDMEPSDIADWAKGVNSAADAFAQKRVDAERKDCMRLADGPCHCSFNNKVHDPWCIRSAYEAMKPKGA